MRIAVISDIHADLGALTRVFSAIEGHEVQEIWCLGDVVGLGGSPLPSSTSSASAAR